MGSDKYDGQTEFLECIEVEINNTQIMLAYWRDSQVDVAKGHQIYLASRLRALFDVYLWYALAYRVEQRYFIFCCESEGWVAAGRPEKPLNAGEVE